MKSSLLLLLTAFTTACDGTQMTVTPTVIQIGQTPSLTIRCDQDPSTLINAMYIYKVSTETTRLASLTMYDPKGALELNSGLSSRANVTGQLSVASPNAYLSLSIFNLWRTDAGTYQCDVVSQSTTPPVDRTVLVGGDGTQMTVNPAVIQIGQTPYLTIRCDQDPGVRVIEMAIKEVSTETRRLASLTMYDQKGALEPNSGINDRAYVTGQLSVASPNAYLFLTIFHPRCTDAGIYQCDVVSEPTIPFVSRTVSATVVAGEVTMTVTPPGGKESVRITCSSIVGTPATGQWVLKRYNKNVKPNSVDLIQIRPIDSCSANSSITWTIYLQADDDIRLYQCYYGPQKFNSANCTIYLSFTLTGLAALTSMMVLLIFT